MVKAKGVAANKERQLFNLKSNLLANGLAKEDTVRLQHAGIMAQCTHPLKSNMEYAQKE